MPNLPLQRMLEIHSAEHVAWHTESKMKKRLFLYIFGVILSLIVIGYILPARLVIPLKGAKTTDWNHQTFWYEPWGKSGVHKGIDIAAVNGQAIFATGDGIITFAGPKGSMGKMIVIDHGHGMATRYGHLKTLSMKQGDNLKRGEVIGFIGTSGRTTGPHLHYEVLVNGIPVKPRTYILD